MRMWFVRTETPKTYWPSSFTIGWFQAMTTSTFRYFEVMAVKIARTVASLGLVDWARGTRRACATRWALVDPREYSTRALAWAWLKPWFSRR